VCATGGYFSAEPSLSNLRGQLDKCAESEQRVLHLRTPGNAHTHHHVKYGLIFIWSAIYLAIAAQEPLQMRFSPLSVSTPPTLVDEK